MTDRLVRDLNAPPQDVGNQSDERVKVPLCSGLNRNAEKEDSCSMRQ
jgi:hypothetical protein